MPKDKEIIDMNAVDEFFKLKDKLALTKDEKTFFEYLVPRIKRQINYGIKIRNIKELVAEVKRCKEKYHISLEYMGKMLDMKHQVLSRILREQVVPQPKTIRKLRTFVEDFS